MTERVWEIAYGGGWDRVARDLIGPVTEAEARRQDAAGEPYTVVAYVDGRPARVIDIHWSQSYCSIWRLDTERRRHRRLDYRRLDPATLTLIGIDQWHFRPGQAEGEHVGHFRQTPENDRAALLLRGPGGARQRRLEPGESWSRPVPTFGDWAPLLDSVEALAATSFSVREPDPHAPTAPERRMWRAPRPMQPTGLDDILTPGRRFRVLSYRRAFEVVTRIVEGPVLRLPTGRLVAADPVFGVRTPFTVTVAPGDYRIFFVTARSDDGHDSVAAVRLEISDMPVAGWEMAVRAGQDVRRLGDEEFYGFSVDGGVAAFYDEAAADLAAYDRDRGDPYFDALHQPWVDYTEPGASGNVVAFACPIGDGTYPVWIGRTASGAVACFVAELELLRSAVIKPD